MIQTCKVTFHNNHSHLQQVNHQLPQQQQPQQQPIQVEIKTSQLKRGHKFSRMAQF